MGCSSASAAAALPAGEPSELLRARFPQPVVQPAARRADPRRRRPVDGPFLGPLDAQSPCCRAVVRTPATGRAPAAWSAHGWRRRRRRRARPVATLGCRRPACDPASTVPRATPGSPPASPAARAAEAKRRRANMLFLLVLTTVCAGFLAATTDSKGMVYLFALSMVALGGYVYLLVTINQQQVGDGAEYSPRTAAPRQHAGPRRRDVDASSERYDAEDDYWEAAPARPDSAVRRRLRRRRPSRRAADSRDGSPTGSAPSHPASIRVIPTAARHTGGTAPRARRLGGPPPATAAMRPARCRCSTASPRRRPTTTRTPADRAATVPQHRRGKPPWRLNPAATVAKHRRGKPPWR